MTEVTVKKKSVRRSGVLVHPTSFPSPFGIGDMGKGAYEFIDFLEKSKQHLWQILPLGPTGFGNSPYQGTCAFASQVLLISPEKLVEDKLLAEQDLYPIPQFYAHRVDYEKVAEYKAPLFQKAFQNFLHTPNKQLLEDYEEFCKKQSYWLDDFSLYSALKEFHNGAYWLDWEEELQTPTPAVRKKWEVKLEKEISFCKFLQFIFQRQWTALKEYANEKEISIIGDIPIFVSLDSSDVWGNKSMFQLDTKGFPTHVAGVPPDYFSETGQLWGNPLYNWPVHEKTNFKWWVLRVKRQLEMVDILRIDHFRGFEAYWSVKATEKTAINGKWIPGPGAALFKAFEKEFGPDLPIIAEDLGIITPEVEELRDSLGLPGMKILQFAFDDDTSVYQPHLFTTTNCICYTGTHDNDTSVGWYKTASEKTRDKIRRYANCDGNSISLDLIRICFSSIAKDAIFPIQDLMKMDENYRMNIPGVAESNWAFRYAKEDLQAWMIDWLKATTELYGRQ